MAQAITYTRSGGPDVLTLTDVPDTAPGAGEVAVRIEAAGINPIDWKIRSGRRGTPHDGSPRRIGTDGAGIVTAVGEGVLGFREGDAVVLTRAQGTYATDVIAPVGAVLPRPPQVSAGAAASLGVPASTAYQSLRSLDVGAGDTLLIHGGSGAVGRLAIQFAVLWGAKVVATSSAARADDIRVLGATPVEYGPGLTDRVRAAAPQGVTVAYDAAGTDEAIETSLDLVADRDRIATIVRGADAASFGIRAFVGGSPTPLTAQEQAWRVEGVPVTLALLAAGAFHVDIGEAFALADAAAAHRASEAGARGKLLLVP